MNDLKLEVVAIGTRLFASVYCAGAALVMITNYVGISTNVPSRNEIHITTWSVRVIHMVSLSTERNYRISALI